MINELLDAKARILLDPDPSNTPSQMVRLQMTMHNAYFQTYVRICTIMRKHKQGAVTMGLAPYDFKILQVD